MSMLSVLEGWHWDDNKGGCLDPELCAKARREEVEYLRRHKMYTRVPREVWLSGTGRAPNKTGQAETDKGQPGKPNIRARWVAKEFETHARPELYASTPLLEELKVVLSEIAKGRLGGKVVALVDVRRAYFYAPARIRVFVELPPEDYQAGDEHMCGLLQYSLYARRRTKLGGRARIDAQRSQADARGRMPVRVARTHDGRARRGDRARR